MSASQRVVSQVKFGQSERMVVFKQENIRLNKYRRLIGTAHVENTAPIWMYEDTCASAPRYVATQGYPAALAAALEIPLESMQEAIGSTPGEAFAEITINL